MVMFPSVVHSPDPAVALSLHRMSHAVVGTYSAWRWNVPAPMLRVGSNDGSFFFGRLRKGKRRSRRQTEPLMQSQQRDPY